MKLTLNEQGQLQVEYLLTHEHEENTVVIPLTIIRSAKSWTATIDQPVSSAKDPEEAAKKLGELLFRAATAIMEGQGNFDNISLNNVEL